MFLNDGDVVAAKYRLRKNPKYREHLKKKAEAARGGGATRVSHHYKVEYLTNRQKRLVAYYKVFKHIYTKGRYGVVLPLPMCLCRCFRKWWPDDENNKQMRDESDDADNGGIKIAAAGNEESDDESGES